MTRLNRYLLFHIIDASTTEEVEADSPEAALNASECSPILCHQCADEVDIGDVIKTIVMDENGEKELLINPSFQDDQIAKLKLALSKMREAFKLACETFEEFQSQVPPASIRGETVEKINALRALEKELLG